MSKTEEDLVGVEEVAKVLDIKLNDWNIKTISLPDSQILSYCRDPLVIKYENIKPNVIDMANPSLEDLEILDDEIEIVEIIENEERDALTITDWPRECR